MMVLREVSPSALLVKMDPGTSQDSSSHFSQSQYWHFRKRIKESGVDSRGSMMRATVQVS